MLGRVCWVLDCGGYRGCYREFAAMPIDFSAYAPVTVLRVRCRDGVEGVVICHLDTSDDYDPHRLVRFDCVETWLLNDGRADNSDIECSYDVTAIIGEMVLEAAK
jgi:hypothetical protein